MQQMQHLGYGSTSNKTILNDEQNVIKLIRLFRGNECLWNPNCEEYRNLALKETIWDTIASQFDNSVTADQVKRKIKGLRNCFSTERSRVQKSLLDGRGEVYVPTLYYYKEFEFLHGITKGRTSNEYVKAEFADDYEEVNGREESLFNLSYTEKSEYTGTDTASHQNEINDDMRIFEPIVLNKTHESQRSYEATVPKRLRSSGTPYASRPSVRNAAQVQSLCEMIKVDLQNVSEELFYEAKWKIMDILREVHRKHLDGQKSQTMFSPVQDNSASGQGMADTSSAALVHNNLRYQAN